MINKIILCMGSSCFTRGNKNNIEIIKKYISNNKIDLEISGFLCNNDCTNGPHIKINGKKFSNVNEKDIIKILNKEL